jgi:ubiquitin carboxyl-terminal hydrolase 8
MLHEFMYQHGYKVLVLDVRNREEFDREHIKADAIVCIEPSVLLRERYVTSIDLQDKTYRI